jgi:hypothetical protein
MIACERTDGGVRICVRAQPGAARDAVVGEHAGALKIAVTKPPEGGRANAAIAKTLARALGVRKSAVTLVAGQTSRDKTFTVIGVSVEDVQALEEADRR